MLRDFITSLIRTYVPMLVGGGLTFLGDGLDVVITDEMASGTTATVVAIASGAYYAAARALESKWPALSFLLGTGKRTGPPTYQRDTTERGRYRAR